MKPNTLKVQLTAINSCLNGIFTRSPLISRFFKAINKLRPSFHKPLPAWSLPLVLKRLTSPPFEPLETSSLKFLTFKCIFLVAITSARRISELQALSSKEPYLRLLSDAVVLRTMPGFLPKVSSTTNINQEIIFPVFEDESEDDLHLLDVKRTISAYLQRTSEFRQSEALFLQFQGPNKGKKASKSSLARWIRDTIKHCYFLENKESPLLLKAHSTRSTAASWAERYHVPMDQICKAATWASPNTFIKHYRIDVVSSEGSAFGSRVLQGAINH